MLTQPPTPSAASAPRIVAADAGSAVPAPRAAARTARRASRPGWPGSAAAGRGWRRRGRRAPARRSRPTSAPESTERVESAARAMSLNARPEDGGASITTDHFVRPVADWPDSVTDTTPGVESMARCTSGAAAVEATTRSDWPGRRGSARPRVVSRTPSRRCTRNCSVCDRPTRVPSRPVRQRRQDRDGNRRRRRPAGCPPSRRPGATARHRSARRRPGAGRTARTTGGRTPPAMAAARTARISRRPPGRTPPARPGCGCSGVAANSRVSSASTTVALLATMAGARHAHGPAQGVAMIGGAARQFLPVAGDQQQGVVGARAEHQHAGDAGGGAIEAQPGHGRDRGADRRGHPIGESDHQSAAPATAPASGT